jgi:hypothetical protein
MRLPLVASLIVTAVSSLASADGRFAQPPPNAAPRVAQIDPWANEDLPPRVVVDRDAVRAKLAANRQANLGRFRAYQAAGVFPSNTYTKSKLNVWLDEQGHFCAAATIIRSSGRVDLANSVAAQNNFIRLGDVRQGPVMDWILTSGLTQVEIAAIQEPFEGVGGGWRDEPEPVVAVDPALRKREDARLMAKYKQVEAQIVKNAAASLDAATDRLMKNPALAAQLLNG